MTRMAGRTGFRVTFARGRRLMSLRVRQAFADPAAQDLAGDWPPPSDCWPMEIVTGGIRFHPPGHDSCAMNLSPGKSAAVTGAAQ